MSGVEERGVGGGIGLLEALLTYCGILKRKSSLKSASCPDRLNRLSVLYLDRQ